MSISCFNLNFCLCGNYSIQLLLVSQKEHLCHPVFHHSFSSTLYSKLSTYLPSRLARPHDFSLIYFFHWHWLLFDPGLFLSYIFWWSWFLEHCKWLDDTVIASNPASSCSVPAFKLLFVFIDGSVIFALVFRGLMKESNQRRNDPNHDDFWKFLSFLLYIFLNVSKFLAADPIKKGKNTWWKMFWKQTAIRIRKKIANTSHYVFHITCLTEETFKCVSKYIKAFLRSFTNFLEFSYSGFYFQVLQMNWKFGMEFISNELGLFLLLLFLYSYNLHQRRFSR